jgi:protein SCO1/2
MLLQRAGAWRGAGALARRASWSGLLTRRFLASSGSAASRSATTPVTWKVLGAMVFVFGGGVAFYAWEKQSVLSRAKDKHRRTIGTALLGGPWTLVDHTGRVVTDASLREGGHDFALLYFGFTYCPDICPAELIKMKQVVDRLDRDRDVGPVVRPVFISVDPRRDGVAQVAHYIRDFHPRTLGLTGTPGQVKAACRAFRVYHSVADQTSEDEYLVDHSIVMYLLGPDGVFIDFYTQMADADECYERIKKAIKERKAQGIPAVGAAI